jgi:hypothetical protein
MRPPVIPHDRPLKFLEELHVQRWDDHRLYHHSRINQSLHFVSACFFLWSYVMIARGEYAKATLIGWLVSMVTRQSGHFFFEPTRYDEVNGLSHQHKEQIKVGYNLARKVWLLSAWALAPCVLWIRPDGFGLFTPSSDWRGFFDHVALVWLVLGGVAVLSRTTWLCATRNVQTGLVWATKILTDPYHDAKIYWRSPLALLRGQLLDPMDDVRSAPQAVRATPAA